MNFILKSDPLPLNSNKISEGYQYYEWYYKQKLIKEQQNEKNLKKLLESIKQQEKTKQNHQKDETKISHNKKHYKGTFYEYNLAWKDKIDQRILTEKKQIQNLQDKYTEELIKNRNISTSLNDQYQNVSEVYKGPILGWDEHFQAYLKSKSQAMTANYDNVTFQPQINNKSRKMMQGCHQKVEERLMKYGEIMKKKHQMQQIQGSSQFQSHLSQNGNKHFISTNSEKSQFFYRLYKDGQLANKRKRNEEQNYAYSFKPKINKIPEKMESRIMMQRKPLYYVKTGLSCSSLDLGPNETLPQKKKGNFTSFLQRNQALIQSKKNMVRVHQQQKFQKQNIERSKCTFKPVLNDKSRKIIEMHEQNSKSDQTLFHQRINQSNLATEKVILNTSRIQIDGHSISRLQKQNQSEQGDSLSGFYLNTNSKDSMQTKRIHVHNPKYSEDLHYRIPQQEYYEERQPQQLFKDPQCIIDLKNTSRNVVTTQAQGLSSSRRCINKVWEKRSYEYNNIQEDSRLENEQKPQEEDSIQIYKQQEQIKNRKWQTQLMKIQEHIEDMMARAICSE